MPGQGVDEVVSIATKKSKQAEGEGDGQEGQDGAPEGPDGEEQEKPARVFQPVQVVEGVIIPFPYEVWQDGVYSRGPKALSLPFPADVNEPCPEPYRRGRTPITSRPIWPTVRGVVNSADEGLLQVRYRTLEGLVVNAWLLRSEVTDHNLLGKLGAQGLPTNSLNNKAVLAYLERTEAANQLRTTVVGQRSGPYCLPDATGAAGSLGWLLGNRWIGPGSLSANPRGNQKYLHAFTSNGNAESWLAKWRELRKGPDGKDECGSWVRRFLMGSAFATPLLRFVNGRTFIVHHWGDSGASKTAIGRFSLSAWGNPDALFSTMNRTVISLTEVFKHITDLPTMYDESTATTVDLPTLIYHVCLNKGRERGAINGGNRDDAVSWLTIVRTTGEVPLVGTKDVGGQFNRVLQINSPAFLERKDGAELYPFGDAHFGHAGPAFLEQLAPVVNAPGGIDQLRALYLRLRTTLVERTGSDTNHAGYAAVIALGQMLAESWLLGIDPAEAQETALADATNAVFETAPGEQLSYAERALGILRDHWVANPTLYINDTTVEGRQQGEHASRVWGVKADWAMVFVPSQANFLLKQAGLDGERVWRDFAKNGWLQVTREAYMTEADLGGGQSRNHPVYAIRPEIFYTSSEVTARRTTLRSINGGRAS